MPIVRLADHLSPDNIFWDLTAADKTALLADLAERISKQETGVDADLLLDLLLERESLQSTGVGDGLALPHAMVPGATKTTLYAGLVTPPLEYDSLDDAPIDLVFLLLSPSNGLREHVRLLARMARIIGQPALLDRMRAVDTADDAYRILVEEDARHVY